MSLVPISIRSNLGLSISSSELSKLQNIDVKSINTVDIARLDKTLSVTKNLLNGKNHKFEREN